MIQVVLLLAVVVVVLVTLGIAVRFVLDLTVKLLRERHIAAEEIVDMNKVPEQWQSHIEKRGLTEEQARRYLLRRTDKLIQYFRTSKLVEDEATREHLLEKLRESRKEWEKRNS